MTTDSWFFTTEQMRSSDRAIWTALRQLLLAKGFDPAKSMLEIVQDGPETVDGIELDSYTCILVTNDRRVFEFTWGEPWQEGDTRSGQWIDYRWYDKTESWAEKFWGRRWVRWAFEQFEATEP